MRLFAILTALAVAAVLYVLVLERDWIMQVAGREPAAGMETETGSETATSPPSDSADNPATAPAVQGPKRVSVVALASSAQVIDRAVVVRGRTEAVRTVDVKAETSGLIVSEPLRKGTVVEAGQPLCEIDPGTRQASLAEARARLAEAEAGLPAAEARIAEALARLEEAEINDNAAERLSEGGFASETRVAGARATVSAARAAVETARSGRQSAQAAIESAAAAIALAETEIARLTVAAPFSGLLETDTGELGALMQPGALCARVIQLDPIKLVGFVPEADVEKVSVGARADARLVSGSRVEGEVVFVSRSADPLTRTFRVEIEVPNADQAIRDGQTAEIAIDSAGAVAHLVPASALTLDDTGALGVRIAVPQDDGDVAAFRKVTLLRDSPEGVYLAGLPEEARVIVVGQEYVTDGVPIAVTLRDPVPSTEAGTIAAPQASVQMPVANAVVGQ